METLTIPDLAYWFEGCVNLTTAELPLASVIGRNAFYGCSKLSTLTMYYGETILESIGEDAFWRELRLIARRRGETTAALIARIDTRRPADVGLATALRLHVLAELRQMLAATGPAD